MANRLNGECLCGAVKYSVSDSFHGFYQCHCKQCQQLTGSAFASNIFTATDNIEWLNGEEKVTKYEHHERGFSKAFCQTCGSAAPYINKSKTALVIPAGGLIDKPDIKPHANIFVSESACWLESGREAKNFDSFPE